MAAKAKPERERAVAVIETDILDRMNETRELIAQRAYEIYQSKGGHHGSGQNDWFCAEDEVLPPLPVHYELAESDVQLRAEVPGFDPHDLVVEVGHRQVVVCGVHPERPEGAASACRNRKVMGIIELPCDVQPGSATATLNGDTLRVSLPRSL